MASARPIVPACQSIPSIKWHTVRRFRMTAQSFQTGLPYHHPGVEKIVFEPRFGLAWSPLGQNTVIRGRGRSVHGPLPGHNPQRLRHKLPASESVERSGRDCRIRHAVPGLYGISHKRCKCSHQCNSAFAANYSTGGSLTTGEAGRRLSRRGGWHQRRLPQRAWQFSCSDT